MPEQDTAHHHLEALPSPAELWPEQELSQALDRMVAAADRCLAELSTRPPWW